MAGLPIDSTHLSDMPASEMEAEFTKMVDSAFAKAAMMNTFFPPRKLTGTNSTFVRRIGTTAIQKVVPGVRPDATPTNHGRVGVVVDTSLVARANQSELDSFQTDYNVRAEIALDQGKQMGRMLDQAYLIQLIKGAGMAAPTGAGGASLGGAIGAGYDVQFAAANDHLDPDKLYDAIVSIITRMQEAEVDTDDLTVFVRPTEFKTLHDNDKLLSSEFSNNNGDFAGGQLYKIFGVPLVVTARIPSSAITGHLLSNADNGFAYDVTADEAKTVVVVAGRNALLAAETIPLRTKIHWSDIELQWFIDSVTAYGVTVRRPDLCGRVRKF